MRKLKMNADAGLTFEEGCQRYLDNCRQRNLREGTIKHYKQSFDQFFKFFDPEMPLAMFTKERYGEYVLHLREMLSSDISINAYLRDLITTMLF